MILRALSLVLILMSALFLPWWAVALLIVPYAMRYAGYEVIVAMVLVDSYYGAFSQLPLLTIASIAVMCGMAFLRPRLRTTEKFV
jgi:hypothetical protein